jgi:L-lysine exporter family protein LysE/ArgO
VLQYLIIFFTSIAFSFAISIPIGGVNMAVFQATLNNNPRAGYLIGLGAILAEIIYCAIPMFSLGETLQKLGIMTILSLLFIPVLLIMGVVTIVRANKEEVSDPETGVKAHHRSAWGNIVYGFFLCASNPMTFVFWMGIVAALLEKQYIHDAWDEKLAWFMGVPVGTWFLYFIFVQIAKITRRRISQVWKARLNIIIGVIFIVMAVYMTISYFVTRGAIAS